MGFTKEYWEENYSEPMTMDCIGNAKEHAKYLYAYFDVEKVDVSSIVDLGFGLGHLFKKMLKTFMPYKAYGIEPSSYAFDLASAKRLYPLCDTMKLTLKSESLQQWCERKTTSKLRFDLGLCTSVFQYLSEEDLTKIIPILSDRVKYLYLTVPTDVELKRQVSELDFVDRFALARSREFYFDVMRDFFTHVSSRVWESKTYFDEDTTLMSDLLYRH